MIKSNGNSKIKILRKLYQKKYRSKHKKYVVEGYQIALDYIKFSRNIDFVLISEEFDKLDLINKIKDEFDMYIVEKNLFNKISETKNSQGIILVVNFEKYDIDILTKKEKLVLIDGIQDPGNLGTIIRTCDAFNIDGIITLENTVDLYNSKTVRASMGSIARIPVAIVDNNKKIVQTLKEKGYRIFSSSPKFTTDIKELKIDNKIALVIGNEGSGVSQEILKSSDDLVGIKMKGDIESLNAGIAAGIMIYEITK